MKNEKKFNNYGYEWYTPLTEKFMLGEYLSGKTIKERVQEICQAAEKILKKPGFAEKFESYFAKGWYSFSTPVWSNFGNERGLPISCFGCDIQDDTADILGTQAEVGIQCKHGGGTSGYFGKIRPRGSSIRAGGNTSGVVHFLRLFDTVSDVISQSNIRRGHFAAYLPIDHGDIEEFLKIKSEHHPIQGLSFGVTVTDEFMNGVIERDQEKMKIWAMVLESRSKTGYPYIFFTDNVNNNTVEVYKNTPILASNMCCEIANPSNKTETFVCDLSSMNVEKYDEWKSTDAVKLLVYFLDAVCSEFIEKAKKVRFMEKAVKFARRHRSIGVGWMGYHTYLQEHNLAWESMEAKYKNIEIAKNIKEKAYEASAELAKEYGEPEMLLGVGRRNTTLLAIAPTKSSAFIIGQTSEGIEPHRANYYIKDLAKGKFSIKNKTLEKLLESKGKNDDEVWNSILKNKGSVEHLDFLTEHEKNVFKTFEEISPKEIVIQAAARQKYIDQSQSLNLMISPQTPVKEVNALMIEAWKLGVKTLYYQLGDSSVKNLSRSITECKSCEA